MNRFKLFDHPQYVNESVYHELAAKLALRFIAQKGVEAVYQIGKVRQPGISDLDLLIICTDDCRINADHIGSLSAEEKYLLPHAPFVLRQSDLTETLAYIHLGKVNLLAGSSIEALEQVKPIDQEFDHQLAFEYLLNFYVSFSRQRSLGWIKERGFLLQARALLFDLDLLGLKETPLQKLLLELEDIRSNWFKHKKDIRALIGQFLEETSKLLQTMLPNSQFRLPASDFLMARNIRLLQDKQLSFTRKGLPLPTWLDTLAPAFSLKLRNKLARYEVRVPAQVAKETESKHHARFACLQRNAQTAASNFPGLMAPGGGISYFYLKS